MKFNLHAFQELCTNWFLINIAAWDTVNTQVGAMWGHKEEEKTFNLFSVYCSEDASEEYLVKEMFSHHSVVGEVGSISASETF